jgi:hypothetical protein
MTSRFQLFFILVRQAPTSPAPFSIRLTSLGLCCVSSPKNFSTESIPRLLANSMPGSLLVGGRTRPLCQRRVDKRRRMLKTIPNWWMSRKFSCTAYVVRLERNKTASRTGTEFALVKSRCLGEMMSKVPSIFCELETALSWTRLEGTAAER